MVEPATFVRARPSALRCVARHRQRLTRTTFHGRRRELRQRYRAGQGDQLGALGLVVNVLVLWTTLDVDRALTQLRAEGATVNDQDVERLSPLDSTQFNFLGRYHVETDDDLDPAFLEP